MSNFIVLIFIIVTTVSFADTTESLGCVVPNSGPHKGVIPEGCSTEPKGINDLLSESKIRCKVVQVLCDPQSNKSYIVKAKVEKWLKGSGPREVSFKFSQSNVKSSNTKVSPGLGRGLCADLTLKKQSMDWVLTHIENPTSSSDALPVCP